MKKAWQAVLLGICALFVAFTAGLLLGRSHGRGGVTVQVPAVLTTVPAATSPPETQTDPTTVFPLDINTADAHQLQALPGIGPVLAQRIVAYREENGPFAQLQELLYVEGIGQTRMEQILDYITIGA